MNVNAKAACSFVMTRKPLSLRFGIKLKDLITFEKSKFLNLKVLSCEASDINLKKKMFSKL